MLRIILCAVLLLQVAHVWGHFSPCHYMEHLNCDGGSAAAVGYHWGGHHWGGHHSDSDNSDSNHHHHHHHHHSWGGHDSDSHNHHGWGGHDSDSHNHHGWGSHGSDSHNHHHGWGSGWHHENWDGNKKVCGSDGVTYKNRCFYVKAHCKQHSLELRNDGPCTPDSGKTSGQPTVTDDFCRNLQKHTCHGVNPICGTKGQSYDNECEFEKAKCSDSSVHIKHLGTC